MSLNLHLQAGLNYIDILQIKEPHASIIARSSDPYTAYCTYIRQLEIECNWEPNPIYWWDVDNSINAQDAKLLCWSSPEDCTCDKYIVGYTKTSDRLIKSLDDAIQRAKQEGYVLEWEVW